MKKIIFLTIILFVGVFYSCKNDWFEIKPKGQGSPETLTSKTGIDYLITGAYAVVDGTHVGDGDGAVWASAVSNWVWGSVASDDAYKGSDYGDQATINPVEGFFADADNGYVANHWQGLYDGVVRTNDILKYLPETEDMNEIERIQAEAQAKFLRAHFYVELTLVHGKVPYIDENTEEPKTVPNDHLLWSEIETDMKFAAENLPGSWSEVGRATSWAAKTYLGRIYLLQGKYNEALPVLNDVYTNGPFELMESYEQNYMIAYNNNEESIFEIQYAANDGADGSPNAGWGDALNFPHGVAGMGTCCGFFQPTHSLVSAYRVGEDGLPLLEDIYTEDDILPYDPDITDDTDITYTDPVDPRLDHTVGRPGIPFLDWGVHVGEGWIRDPSNGGPYLYKKNMFKQSEKGLATTTGWATGVNPNNFRKFRLGHVILWLAECEAQVGSLERATNLVNEIRNRTKNSNVVTFEDGTPAANYLVEPYAEVFESKEFAMKAIQHEQRLEFAMEGLRFFDLERWGIIDEVMNNYLDVEGTRMVHLEGKNFIAGKHEKWPIPQTQRDLSVDDTGNTVLDQTEGY